MFIGLKYWSIRIFEYLQSWKNFLMIGLKYWAKRVFNHPLFEFNFEVMIKLTVSASCGILTAVFFEPYMVFFTVPVVCFVLSWETVDIMKKLPVDKEKEFIDFYDQLPEPKVN
jgi:hypothetical protein